MISGEEFLERKSEIAEEIEQLQKKIKALALLTWQEKQREISYELVRDILQSFSKVLNSDGIERGLKKQLLHMLISEISIDKRREIDSIHIRLTGELVQFLQNTGGISIRGVPPDFLCAKMRIPAFNLEFAI